MRRTLALPITHADTTAADDDDDWATLGRRGEWSEVPLGRAQARPAPDSVPETDTEDDYDTAAPAARHRRHGADDRSNGLPEAAADDEGDDAHDSAHDGAHDGAHDEDNGERMEGLAAFSKYEEEDGDSTAVEVVEHGRSRRRRRLVAAFPSRPAMCTKCNRRRRAPCTRHTPEDDPAHRVCSECCQHDECCPAARLALRRLLHHFDKRVKKRAAASCRDGVRCVLAYCAATTTGKNDPLADERLARAFDHFFARRLPALSDAAAAVFAADPGPR